MREVLIAGVGMTPFGIFLNRTSKDLTKEAVEKALADSGISKEDIQAAYVGNSVAGVVTGQETIRGQVFLKDVGIGSVPIFNIENACASSSTAFHLASVGIASGMYDCVLVVGVEKMTHEDKSITFKAFEGGLDVEENAEKLKQSSGKHSIFMEVYASEARKYMKANGVKKKHLAQIAAKNHTHGSLNPYAQKRIPKSIDDVLNDRLIVEPFTKSMCSPVSDGAASLILCSKDFFKRINKKPVYLAASVVQSADPLKQNEAVIKRASQIAYEQAGIGPEDVDVFEVHDAAASAELVAYEELGLCRSGEAVKLVEENITARSGTKPVNVSGGLIAKGHPVGATGLGQIIELVWQLREEAGEKQLPTRPIIGLAQNAGGHLGHENAACTITIVKV